MYFINMSILFYNDQVLNNVMSSLLSYNRDSLRSELNSYIETLQRPSIMRDARYLIACGILSVMIENCGSHGRMCSLILIKTQVERIASSIKPSLRWRVLGPAFWKWLDRFDLEKSGDKELKLMNEVEELFLGIVSFTGMETREKKKIERCFKRFVKKIGFENYDEFATSSHLGDDHGPRCLSNPSLQS